DETGNGLAIQIQPPGRRVSTSAPSAWLEVLAGLDRGHFEFWPSCRSGLGMGQSDGCRNSDSEPIQSHEFSYGILPVTTVKHSTKSLLRKSSYLQVPSPAQHRLPRWLLFTKGDHSIDSCRSAGWEIRGNCGDPQKHRHCDCKRHRIMRR